eukprot:365153-Chlamydomonas_euryale.AAC.2
MRIVLERAQASSSAKMSTDTNSSNTNLPRYTQICPDAATLAEKRPDMPRCSQPRNIPAALRTPGRAPEPGRILPAPA